VAAPFEAERARPAVPAAPATAVVTEAQVAVAEAEPAPVAAPVAAPAPLHETDTRLPSEILQERLAQLLNRRS
jgi:hypothetical protein